MDLPVATDTMQFPSEEAAAGPRALVEWINARLDGAVVSTTIIMEVAAQARLMGVDCRPRLARQLKERPGERPYWAVVIDPGFPVDPQLWEGDYA